MLDINCNIGSHRLSTISTLPIPWSQFYVPLNLDFHTTPRYSKMMRHNPLTTASDYKNISEHQSHRWILCFWGHTNSIPKIWSHHQHCFKGGQFTLGFIASIPQCTWLDIIKMSFMTLGKKGKHLDYMFHIFMQGRLQQRQIHWCSNLYLQWVWSTTSSCRSFCHIVPLFIGIVHDMHG